jgi:uncharacterized protein (TIGR03437 family)
MRLAFLLLLPCLVGAQLIPNGAPIPKGPNPPAVFLNGYQLGCTSPSDFAGTFGNADQVLQASGIASVFFDNCTVTAASGQPTIEAIGIAFAKFLAGLKYTDGSAVPQVDAVVHSMGGLILRSYLAGKQDLSPAAYAPPAATGIRKALFIGTPHFGTPLAPLLGTDVQTAEMSPGSQFLFDLNTWNEGVDDLRGVDALAIAGSGGTGNESSGPVGFDDGVVALTSASLGFVPSIPKGRTRVIPGCHTTISLLYLFGECANGTPPIAAITDASNITGQIMTSFLTGTNAWQSLGMAIEDNALGSTKGGVYLQFQDSNGAPQNAPATVPSNLTASTTKQVLWSEKLASGAPVTFPFTPTPVTFTPIAGTITPLISKPGPVIHGAVPAGGAVFPLDVAPGAYVAIYGSALAGSKLVAPGPNFPTQLGDVQVSVNGAAAEVQFISSGQINMIWPDSAPGLTKLTVTNAAGSFTTNVIVQPSVPSVFTFDGTTAAAENAVTGAIVSASAPLASGTDYVALFLTGLGDTTSKGGLDYANIQPSVTIGGKACTVLYGGRVSGVPALDQINCQIPAGLSGAAVPVVVSANGRTANTVTISVK